MSDMTTVEAAIKVLWREPMIDGFPRGTDLHCWMRHWDHLRDGYPIWMTTYFKREVVYSSVLLAGQALKRCEADEGSFRTYLSHQLRLLRMRHYFALAYARGGYC